MKTNININDASEREDFATDFEIQSARTNTQASSAPWYNNIPYFVAGCLFGILLIKSEVVSWFRIQEMFRFQSFHMYGVIGSAVCVGMISVLLIRRFNVKTFAGKPIVFDKKPFHKGNVFGGLLFGFGWALTGACPGPLFALVGNGAIVILVVLISAIAGTWVYGAISHRLPH